MSSFLYNYFNMEAPKLLERGWKYELKSAARTFLAFFVIVLSVQFKDLELKDVGASLASGGMAAAVRSLFVIIIEPLAISAWSAFMSLLQGVATKVKGEKE